MTMVCEICGKPLQAGLAARGARHPWCIPPVLAEVAAERRRQDARWGQQDHDNGTGGVFRANADLARERCQSAFKDGDGTWQNILEKKFWEACAESDPKALRVELIQVAAVAVAWVEAIDRAAEQEARHG